MQTTLRVRVTTRNQLARAARDDFNGVSLDETIVRLLREHWQRMAVADVQADPAGWDAELADAQLADAASAPPIDSWETVVPAQRAERISR